MTIPTPPSTTVALSYFVPPADNARAYTHINEDPKTGVREHNYTREDQQVEVENLGGRENAATLDTTGFQFVKRAAKHTAFVDEEAIKKEYYAESIDLIKDVTGASRVVLFDHSMSILD